MLCFASIPNLVEINQSCLFEYQVWQCDTSDTRSRGRLAATFFCFQCLSNQNDSILYFFTPPPMIFCFECKTLTTTPPSLKCIFIQVVQF